MRSFVLMILILALCGQGLSQTWEFESWIDYENDVLINDLPYLAVLQNTTSDGSLTFTFVPILSEWPEEEEGPRVGSGSGGRAFTVGFSGGHIDENGTEVEDWNKTIQRRN